MLEAAFAVTVACAAVPAQPTLAGAWQTISAHESITPPPEVAYDDWDTHGIKITIINGPQPETAKLNGRFYPVKGDPNVDAIAVRRLNPRTLVVRLRKKHWIVTSHREVSADGKQMTVADTGHDAKGPVHVVSIWQKESTEEAGLPYVGRWRQEYLRVTFRKPPVYRFELHGDQFQGSSTAGLQVAGKTDGKPHPQKDGSVAVLKRLDGQTLDVTDTRGGTLEWLMHVQLATDGDHATLSWEPPATSSGKQAKITTILKRIQ
jgi:hypothetical protein